MEENYKILGLKPGASTAEIKRAYFKLVRQFPPEKDPERFQQIRRAYEDLTQKNEEKPGLVFPPLDDPRAVSMMRQITQARERGDDILFRDTCQEAWNYFPDKIQFLYLLVIAQRHCGNTGKAVNNAKILVKKEPDNQWFWRELAVSYLERGYTKKAFPAFEKAYELGSRDRDFIMMYADECRTCGEYEKAIHLLRGMVSEPKDWKQEDIPEYTAAFGVLFVLCGECGGLFLEEVEDTFLQALDAKGKYMADYMPVFLMILDRLSIETMEETGEFEKAEEILSKMEEFVDDEDGRSMIKEVRFGILIEKLEMDSRFTETMKAAVEAFCRLDFTERVGARERKYNVLDSKLCMIMEKGSVMRQAEILKEEYYVFYERMQTFFEQLEDEKNLAYLKDRLIKEYMRMSRDFEAGRFSEEYPQELVQYLGTAFYEGDMPYVRTGKKIGRNDPCPCGSGKKYKHCCMRRQGK